LPANIQQVGDVLQNDDKQILVWHCCPQKTKYQDDVSLFILVEHRKDHGMAVLGFHYTSAQQL
jgi:hypothetical protein